MRVIAREKINGINDDKGLSALDGIKEIEAQSQNVDEILDKFEDEFPGFNAVSFEIVLDNCPE